MTTKERLIKALMNLTDRRGHWPGCPQSVDQGFYTTILEDQTEVASPCSASCANTRQAIEAAGVVVVQQIGRSTS